MSKFNVHEWNYKRRLAEIENNTEEMRSEAVTNLIDAIEIAKNYNLFNTAQELALGQITTSLIKNMARERGDLNEQKLDIEEPGNPLYDLNNNDRDVAILNGLISKYGLNTVQLWITSGEYSRDYM